MLQRQPVVTVTGSEAQLRGNWRRCGKKVSGSAAGPIVAVRRSTFAMARAFTVLLVDDDDLVRAPLAALLELHGVRVLTATSAIEAIRILGQERADVLFTDIVMPDQDGIELAKHAKVLQPHLRVMFATGYFSRAASAEQLGKLLFKPLRADEVQAALDDVLADKSPPPRKRR